MSDYIKTEKVLDLLARVVAEIIKMPPEESEESVLEKPARDLIDKQTIDLILGRTETHDKRTETHSCVSPCDICRHYPPSSADGKPCSMCPAEPTEQVMAYMSLADCVSRQAAINAVCSVCGDTECNIFDPDNKAKLYCPEPYAIMKLPSAEPQWIPCSEPPKNEGTYLVYAPDYKGGSSSAKENYNGVMFSKYKNGKWSIEHGYYERPNCVTAWMPMPKPYKAGEQE